MIDLNSLPMWLKIAVVVFSMLLILGFSAVILCKLFFAEKIKAGVSGIEIEDVVVEHEEKKVVKK